MLLLHLLLTLVDGINLGQISQRDYQAFILTNVARIDPNWYVSTFGATISCSYSQCGPVGFGENLYSAAIAHSSDMVSSNCFGHNTCNCVQNCDYATRLTGYGVVGAGTYQETAENVAKGETDPVRLINLWLGSVGHCENIYNPHLTQSAVSIVGSMSTQDFGGPSVPDGIVGAIYVNGMFIVIMNGGGSPQITIENSNGPFSMSGGGNLYVLAQQVPQCTKYNVQINGQTFPERGSLATDCDNWYQAASVPTPLNPPSPVPPAPVPAPVPEPAPVPAPDVQPAPAVVPPPAIVPTPPPPQPSPAPPTPDTTVNPTPTPWSDQSNDYISFDGKKGTQTSSTPSSPSQSPSKSSSANNPSSPNSNLPSGTRPPLYVDPNSSSSSSQPQPSKQASTIIGATVASAAALLVCGFFVYRAKKNRELERSNSINSTDSSNAGSMRQSFTESFFRGTIQNNPLESSTPTDAMAHDYSKSVNGSAKNLGPLSASQQQSEYSDYSDYTASYYGPNYASYANTGKFSTIKTTPSLQDELPLNLLHMTKPRNSSYTMKSNTFTSKNASTSSKKLNRAMKPHGLDLVRMRSTDELLKGMSPATELSSSISGSSGSMLLDSFNNRSTVYDYGDSLRSMRNPTIYSSNTTAKNDQAVVVDDELASPNTYNGTVHVKSDKNEKGRKSERMLWSIVFGDDEKRN